MITLISICACTAIAVIGAAMRAEAKDDRDQRLREILAEQAAQQGKKRFYMTRAVALVKA